jgi:hypothetical protein
MFDPGGIELSTLRLTRHTSAHGSSGGRHRTPRKVQRSKEVCPDPCTWSTIGYGSQVPYYDHALDLILDSDSTNNEALSEEQHEVVETAAEMLYGLIHVRYILTARGMAAMHEKLKRTDFGTCPRVLCAGQACLPCGMVDVPRQCTVKVSTRC